ncbi:MAG: hypothetical protein LUH05_08750 [Candidatus Gastranaerophilales bacterium]|nr:hypothetical protein [Candidatus Gastranaerophilales bacterium]
MTRNQLPEGVGKKIVEALKRQAEADITPVSSLEETAGNNIPLTDIQDLPELKFEPLKEETDLNDNLIVEEETNILPAGVYKNKEEIPAVPAQGEPAIFEKPVFTAEIKESQPKTYVSPNMSINNETIQKAVVNSTIQINIPSNVAVLRNLITSLPVGVTKQTGAQIIRQTLEAMGLPMNSVLKEAQELQEELSSSSRECMLRIQEYKTNILQLEQSVQEYQKNITQINDLVSLFLLTDRK